MAAPVPRPSGEHGRGDAQPSAATRARGRAATCAAEALQRSAQPIGPSACGSLCFACLFIVRSTWPCCRVARCLSSVALLFSFCRCVPRVATLHFARLAHCMLPVCLLRAACCLLPLPLCVLPCCYVAMSCAACCICMFSEMASRRGLLFESKRDGKRTAALSTSTEGTHIRADAIIRTHAHPRPHRPERTHSPPAPVHLSHVRRRCGRQGGRSPAVGPVDRPGALYGMTASARGPDCGLPRCPLLHGTKWARPL